MPASRITIVVGWGNSLTTFFAQVLPDNMVGLLGVLTAIWQLAHE